MTDTHLLGGAYDRRSHHHRVVGKVTGIELSPRSFDDDVIPHRNLMKGKPLRHLRNVSQFRKLEIAELNSVLHRTSLLRPGRLATLGIGRMAPTSSCWRSLTSCG